MGLRLKGEVYMEEINLENISIACSLKQYDAYFT